jgi:integrase/recombinase XerC
MDIKKNYLDCYSCFLTNPKLNISSMKKMIFYYSNIASQWTNELVELKSSSNSNFDFNLLDDIKLQKHFSDDFKGLRDKLLINLFYSTGIRLSELQNLFSSNIDFFHKQIKVLGKRNKERIIPITSETLALIKIYNIEKLKMGFSNQYLLLTNKGEQLDPKFIYNTVKKYLSQVTTLSKRSPHVLRHTYATQLLNKGADLNAIKELLGHSSLAATQIYTHNSIQQLKEVYKKHPRK